MAAEGRELLAAGAQAYGRGDVQAARRLFRAAARDTDDGVRISAMVNAAGMSDQLGEHADAAAEFRIALALMAPDAHRMRASALVNLSQALQHLGNLDEATAALEQARACCAEHDELAEVRVACLLSLTAVAVHRQDWVRAIELGAESLDVALRCAPGLAGHPLMNLAAAHFETGRRELAEDFAGQALAAFEAAGDANAVAETRQNLAIMRLRTGKPAAAEPLLRVSQEYFERAGFGHRGGIGRKMLGLVAEERGALAEAQDCYARSLAYFEATGAVLDAADVRIRLATMAFADSRVAEGEALLARSFAAYAARGLGLHCAQIDFWHAHLLAARLDDAGTATPTPRAAVDLSVVSALAIDAVRYTLPNGAQRQQWNEQVADPALRLAFRFAHRAADPGLLGELIETRCAGATLNVDRTTGSVPPQLGVELLATTEPGDDPPAGALVLGAALAEVAAGAGIPVAPPPHVALPPDGRPALAGHIAAAERHYGRRIREPRVLPRVADEPRPTLVVRMADAGDLFLSWRWLDGGAPGGVAAIPEADVLAAAHALSDALPRPTEPGGLERAMTTGAFASSDAESSLAQCISDTLLPELVRRQLRARTGAARPLLRIQPSPRTAQIPWELAAFGPDERLLDLADVSLLPPAGVVHSPGRTPRRWADTRDLPVVAVLDPRVPGHRADSALGSVLGRMDPQAPLAIRVADHARHGRLRPAVADPTAAFRRTDLDRDWLATTLSQGASRLIYVGHVTAAPPASGQSEQAELHLCCGADTLGFAAAARGHRPLSAKDLLLGTHTLAPDPADGAHRWPMPGRVALIACESGGDQRFTEALGLIAAIIHSGAELVTATRWPLPTDLAFHRLAGASPAARPLHDAICAIDAAHDQPDPVAALNTWQRQRLAAWRATPTPENSPILWSAFTTATTD